jgi:hypothetical protein
MSDDKVEPINLAVHTLVSGRETHHIIAYTDAASEL